MHARTMTALVFALGMITPVSLFTGCVQKGPAQRAGERIDNTVQEMQDAVDPPGPAQKAGRSLDRALGN
jgi:hypothetical protein